MSEKQLESNIKLLEEYKKAVDAGSAVSKTDLRGKITYANEQFFKISGYCREELIGHSHNIVRDPDVQTEVYENLWETIKRKETWRGKIKNRAKDGSSYYLNIIIIPILNNYNNIVEYLALGQDITEFEELNHFLEKRVKQEVKKNREKDTKNIATLTGILEKIPNPIVIYNGPVVEFVNLKFVNLSHKAKSELLGTKFDLESLFDDKVGCISTLKEINPKNSTDKVSISTNSERNIFHIMVDDVLCFNGTIGQMYTFNNITLVEYQKLKISYYSERLEDFIKKMHRGAYGSKNELLIADTKEYDDTSQSERILNSKEKEVLKKSRNNLAISSTEYSQDIDTYVLEEIDELSEIEAEIDELITLYSQQRSLDLLGDISIKFLKYASTVSLLIEFEDLSFAIRSLADLIHTIKEDDIDDSKHKKIQLYLSNILLDLSSWRRTVFVYRTTNDIHYLDSSLFSTILQFELIFSKEVIIEDEDDFELFQ